MTRKVEKVDEETPLRMKRGERLPDRGEDNPIQVSDEDWKANNQRKDTASGQATEREPVE